MKQLSILAVSSLLLVSTVFAAEKRAAEPPQAEKQLTTATVQVAGQTIATLTMTDDVVLSFSAQSRSDKKVELIYDPAKDVITYNGKCTLEARKGDKRLLQLVVDDGVVIMGPAKEMVKIFDMLKSQVKK